MKKVEIINAYLDSLTPEQLADFKTCYENFPQKNQMHKSYVASHWKLKADRVGERVSTNSATQMILPKEKKIFDLTTWKPGQENFSDEMFETFETGKGIDILLSMEGGVTKGSQYIATGEPGVGKTTVLADIQYCFQQKYPEAKIACIQSEMKKFDVGYEYKKNGMEWMGQIDYIFLKDHGYENIKLVLTQIFQSGYDVLFLDSYDDIVEKMVAFCGNSTKESEQFILSLMDNASDAKNNQGVFTTTFAIKQVNKDGNFKGSNVVKHMTTGMLHLKFDETGQRCIVFSKNRRNGGQVHKKMYYSLSKDTKEVVYNLNAFKEAEAAATYAKEQQEKLSSLGQNFFDFVGKKLDENSDESSEEEIEKLFQNAENELLKDKNIISEAILVDETDEEI